MTAANHIPLPPLSPRAAYRIACWGRRDELTARKERGDTYSAYLESDEWQRPRQLALEHYGRTCCLCNAHENLHVHHRTYARLGNERLADLAVICRACHEKHHDKAA